MLSTTTQAAIAKHSTPTATDTPTPAPTHTPTPAPTHTPTPTPTTTITQARQTTETPSALLTTIEGSSTPESYKQKMKADEAETPFSEATRATEAEIKTGETLSLEEEQGTGRAQAREGMLSSEGHQGKEETKGLQGIRSQMDRLKECSSL